MIITVCGGQSGCPGGEVRCAYHRLQRIHTAAISLKRQAFVTPPPLSHTHTHTHVQVLELEPGNAVADGMVKRLTPVVNERREKLKDEMMGARSKHLLCCGVGKGWLPAWS